MSNLTPARKCFWFDETHATEHGYKVNIVTENEDGYMPTNVVLNMDYILARVTVANLNEQAFGVTDDDAREIVMSSMFPAARKAATNAAPITSGGVSFDSDGRVFITLSGVQHEVDKSVAEAITRGVLRQATITLP